MRRRTVVVALAAFLLAALAGPIALVFGSDRTQAAFGDSETLGVNRLSSATVDVEIGLQSVAITAEALAPGDRAVGSIEIRNEGTLPIRYAIVSSITDDPLTAWLSWDLWPASSPTRCAEMPSPSDLLVSGRVLSSATDSVLGDATVGPDPGDRILDPDTTETMCVGATFDLAAPDAVQNRRLEQQFTVVAEQYTDGLSS